MSPVISGGASAGGLTPFYSTTVSGSSTTTVGPAASSIPATGSILDIFIWGQTTAAGGTSANTITFNGDTGANYDYTQVNASSSSVSASFTAAAANVPEGWTHGAGATATYGGGTRITVPAYASTAFWKTAMVYSTLPEETTAASFWLNATFGWRSTAAINQVTITAASGHYVAGTICVAYVY